MHNHLICKRRGNSELKTPTRAVWAVKSFIYSSNQNLQIDLHVLDYSTIHPSAELLLGRMITNHEIKTPDKTLQNEINRTCLSCRRGVVSLPKQFAYI